MKINFWTNRNGTALLVALLVMGVLIAISLILSSLILREIRITKDLIDSGKAYYAAESGIEMSLYGLNNNLPGWQPRYKSFKVDEEYNAVGEYKVDNRCNSYPCFESGFDLKGVPAKEFYDVLDLNEAITIPLFIAEDDGSVKDVEHFTVEFFAPFNPVEHLNISSEDLYGWDVLRWKIFGIHKDVNVNVTETISDFTAVNMVNTQDSEDFMTNSSKPSWFGTISCSQDLSEEQKKSRYATGIECIPYFVGSASGELVEIDPEEFGQVSKIFAGRCSQTEAREYYAYQYIGDERKLISINGCYSIRAFLEEHKLNYLSLTNLINPAVFVSDVDKEALSKLYFRVELFTDQTVREFADITSDGYSGKTKKSINVKIKRGSFMPVFNFSLYSTYMDEEAQHGYDYWYEEE